MTTTPSPGVTTPPTDEQLRTAMWQAIVDVRDAAPRRPDDADSEHIVDALEPIVAQALADQAAAIHARYEKVAEELDDFAVQLDHQQVRTVELRCNNLGWASGIRSAAQRIREVSR